MFINNLNVLTYLMFIIFSFSDNMICAKLFKTTTHVPNCMIIAMFENLLRIVHTQDLHSHLCEGKCKTIPQTRRNLAVMLEVSPFFFF